MLNIVTDVLFGCLPAKIGLFYLIFYSCLAGFFAIMLTGFFTTLSDDHPKQTGLFSLIKGNPGTVAFALLTLWFDHGDAVVTCLTRPMVEDWYRRVIIR